VSEPRRLALLAIDDSAENLELVRAALEQADIDVLTATDPEAGFNTFLRVRPRIVLLDLVMPKMSGIELLERILAADPATDVILITSHYSTDSAVQAIQKGASDYWTKPLDVEKLRNRIQTLLEDAATRKHALRLDREVLNTSQFEGMVGHSPLMLDVFARVRRVAPHFRTVLVTGATGTGKELVAQALHRLSPVSKQKFAVCNCSALVENLLESELFGHVRGSFTGATQDKPGLFEYADGGTIFLDEIGELSPPAQAKLLRVLQNRQVQRVGSVTTKSIDVHVIAATNRDLKGMVGEGRFREDLYYRLAMVEITLPNLAARGEDLPLLERYFVEKFAAEYDKPISGLTRRVQARMATYPWPGNIRELENVIGNACMMVEGNVIDIEDLPESLRRPVPCAKPTNGDETFLSLEEVQRRHILRVLQAVGGHKARAAEILGIGRATIYQMLSKMKIDSEPESHQSHA
jgi:DNA-binding NtrC family response regulator